MERNDQTFMVLRERLETERAELLAMAGERRAAGATVELDQTRTGRLSRIDALQGQAMAKAGIERAENRLRQIAAALRRLETGEYGECQICGEVISEGRLNANPAVASCIACAEKAES